MGSKLSKYRTTPHQKHHQTVAGADSKRNDKIQAKPVSNAEAKTPIRTAPSPGKMQVKAVNNAEAKTPIRTAPSPGKMQIKAVNNAEAKTPIRTTASPPSHKREVFSEDVYIAAPKDLPASYAQSLFPWAPPNYSPEDEHARAGPSSTLKHTSEVLASDDPIVACARHNQTRPLYTIPIGVLLRIIEDLDDVDIECFRRTARRFPPPCAEVIVCRYPDRDLTRCNVGPFPWPTDLGLKSNALATAQFLCLLDRDRYCRGCLVARQAPEWEKRIARLREYLSCSACGTQHPACLFSAKERARPRRRQCIGHEGYLRICGHDQGIFRWSDVLHLAHSTDAAGDSGRRHQVEWRCPDKSHLTACGVPENALCQLDAFEECMSSYPHLDSSRYLFPTLGCGQYRPGIYIGWQVHVPLGRLGEWPPTASTLRRHLAEIRANAGRFMFPAKGPDAKLQELRCFDPNDCDCVYFEGSEHVDWRPYRPVCDWTQGRGKRCTNNPSSRFLPVPHLLEISPSTMQLLRRAASSQQIKACVDGECGLEKSFHNIRDISYRKSEIEWLMQAALCHNTSPCLRLDYHRILRDTISADDERMMGDWYRALDTESYNLTEDKEGFEVFWCREPNCRNNHESCPDFDALVSGTFYPYECVPGSQQLMYHSK